MLRVDVESALRGVPALARLLEAKGAARTHLTEWGRGVEWFAVERGADNVDAWAKEHAEEVSHPTFEGWMHRHGLSLNAAAESLRINRRMVSDSRTGQKSIPRAMWWVCPGCEVTKSRPGMLPRRSPTARECALTHA
jgi:hypothetical protein